MEPKSPAPSHEQLPTPVEYSPVNPEVAPASPETTHEKLQASPERGQELHKATTLAAPTQVVALPTPVAPLAQDTFATSTQDDNPIAAADEDLIEKEWVDKAKQIVTRTKDDPHAREREVNKLQIDYLKKRYGKELGSST